MERRDERRVGADDQGSGGIDLHYGHPRMPVADRAKIFMPFNPLRGFTEALRAQEELRDREEQD